LKGRVHVHQEKGEDDDVLPDYLEEGQWVVFVGTAASDVSAVQGHYYANPRNWFWRLLSRAGVTDRTLTPEEDHLLSTYGFGLTDVVKVQHSGNDARLPKELLTAGAHLLAVKIRRYVPQIVCFTSKNAYRAFFRRTALTFGLQADTIGDSRIFVTPSPSPRVPGSRVMGGKTRLQWYQALGGMVDAQRTRFESTNANTTQLPCTTKTDEG
jgi:TDG/mug DNA glycosylase family protein